jgi:hypothetical protein
MLRIVDATTKCTRIIVWCLLVSVNVFMDVGVILNFIPCGGRGLSASPSEMRCGTSLVATKYNVFASGRWIPIVPITEETSQSRSFSWTVWSSAADIVLALLAWVIISPLQMRAKDKFGVAVAMSLGIVYVVPYRYCEATAADTPG